MTSSAVRAQGTGVFRGRILDSAGAPVAAGRIRVPEVERVASADSLGRFRLEGLPARRLTVVAEAPGFHGSRQEIGVPAGGEVELSFSLRPNTHLLEAVAVRARRRPLWPDKLSEFSYRQSRGVGRFLDPDQIAEYDGKPLTDALRKIVFNARFTRNSQGQMTLVSSRALSAPTSLRPSTNVKPCGVQIWQDGLLLSDPNASGEFVLPSSPTGRTVVTAHGGADRDYDISDLLANSYMAVEYYSDLATTPPGFRTGTMSCGVLVLWTRVPMRETKP
jgi:hypothetical protein